MKGNTPRRVVIFAVALFIVLIIVLFSFLRSPDVPEYVTAPVRKDNIENSVLATGRIDAIERVNVGAQVSGQVKTLKVKQGDCMTKGQLIAKIDDLSQRNDLRNAEAALSEVKAELQSKRVLLKHSVMPKMTKLRTKALHFREKHGINASVEAFALSTRTLYWFP